MNDNTAEPWTSFEELKKYIEDVDHRHLLELVEKNGDRFYLNEDKYARVTLPSQKRQLACIFAVLGEYEIADRIHKPKWEDFGRIGDKIANGILQKFIQPWPH